MSDQREKPRPDVYGVARRLGASRDWASDMEAAVYQELGIEQDFPADYEAVKAALEAFAAAMGPRWDADDGGRWDIDDLARAVEKVSAIFIGTGHVAGCSR